MVHLVVNSKYISDKAKTKASNNAKQVFSEVQINVYIMAKFTRFKECNMCLNECVQQGNKKINNPKQTYISN